MTVPHSKPLQMAVLSMTVMHPVVRHAVMTVVLVTTTRVTTQVLLSAMTVVASAILAVAALKVLHHVLILVIASLRLPDQQARCLFPVMRKSVRHVLHVN